MLMPMRGLVIIILLLSLTLGGCKKTPGHVIGKGAMADLMADMYKAEAVIDENEGVYHTDSLKMMLRQSVMMKHNVTQAQLDTSLIWYTHNLDVYNDVYEDIIEQLDDEYKELAKGDFTSVATVASSDMKPSMPRFRTVGDTADIWGRSRTWVLLPGFSDNLITFDLKPDKENMQGDKYELAFKLCNVSNTLKAFIGVDYKDGSSAFVYRTATRDGWNHCILQSDSLRDVKRIYGYLSYKSKPKQAMYVDSVELLRTHLDRKTYEPAMKLQKWIGKKDLKIEEDEQEDEADDKDIGKSDEDKVKTPKLSPRAKRLEALKKLEKQEDKSVQSKVSKPVSRKK